MARRPRFATVAQTMSDILESTIYLPQSNRRKPEAGQRVAYLYGTVCKCRSAVRPCMLATP